MGEAGRGEFRGGDERRGGEDVRDVGGEVYVEVGDEEAGDEGVAGDECLEDGGV